MDARTGDSNRSDHGLCSRPKHGELHHSHAGEPGPLFLSQRPIPARRLLPHQRFLSLAGGIERLGSPPLRTSDLTFRQATIGLAPAVRFLSANDLLAKHAFPKRSGRRIISFEVFPLHNPAEVTCVSTSYPAPPRKTSNAQPD